VNGLGPTESTLALQYFLDHETELPQHTVPIGYEVADTEVRLINEAGDEVIGFGPGEIEITSQHLARGYWLRQELTEAAFKDDKSSGRRRYRTGDMARRLWDGSLEYLGRKDHQVKVRGVRVELGEIEAELMRYAGVSSAVVTAFEAQLGEKQLACYVTASENEPQPTESGLRSYLNERLPAPMVPSSYVVLEKLPLTPNGKVDRRALPAPAQSGRARAKQFVGPRTPVEEIVAGIWSEILGVKEIGINDNFFELGGHSLLGTQVISRVREAFQVELPLRRLFEGATIKELAASVEAASSRGRLAARMRLTRVRRGAELPLSYAQQRLWLLDKLEPNNPSYHMATAVRLRGSFSVAGLGWAVNQLVVRHETLRTNFVVRGGVPVQVVAEPAPLEIELVEVSAAAESTGREELQRLLSEEVERPFELATGRLLRVKVIRVGSAAHVVLITMHHIISDAWSMEIFVRELARLYEARVSGEPARLPELPVQYADYAVAQRDWLKGAVLEEQLGYWKQQLGEELPVVELPLDHVRPAVQTFRGGRRRLSLTRETSEELKRLSRGEGATLFMTLLAGFKVLLHYYTAADEIIVGTPIAGRNQVEVETLIGCFLNTLVLRTELRGNPTFRELMGRVKEVALGAYAHQEAPFELLLGELQPERDLSRTPLFQVMFNLLNVTETEIRLPGLMLETMAPPDAGAKFDLTVYAFEKAGRLQFAFVYNRDLFEDATIARMVKCFQVLLAVIARHPEQSISSLINELPFVANRKMDRQALPKVSKQREPKEYLAPSTPAEKIVAEVWGEVLGIEQVGRNDNFFEIGGHSLLATQVISRVQETFEVEMPLRSLFEHPTLSAFAIAIEVKIVESIEALTEEAALAML